MKHANYLLAAAVLLVASNGALAGDPYARDRACATLNKLYRDALQDQAEVLERGTRPRVERTGWVFDVFVLPANFAVDFDTAFRVSQADGYGDRAAMLRARALKTGCGWAG